MATEVKWQFKRPGNLVQSAGQKLQRGDLEALLPPGTVTGPANDPRIILPNGNATSATDAKAKLEKLAKILEAIGMSNADEGALTLSHTLDKSRTPPEVGRLVAALEGHLSAEINLGIARARGHGPTQGDPETDRARGDITHEMYRGAYPDEGWAAEINPTGNNRAGRREQEKRDDPGWNRGDKT